MTGRPALWRVLRKEDGTILLARVRWCAGFWCKFRGLMFRRDLAESEGLLFVYDRESRVDTTIHMLFMRFAIATVWLNAEGVVVDKVLARPWRLAYAPRQPARYFIEASPSLLEHVMIGDRLVFDEAAEA